MAKKRVVCPECGHRHTVKIDSIKGRRSGIRARAGARKGDFEYTITATDQQIESGHFSSVTDDLILTAAFGVIVGGTCGILAGLALPDYTIEAVGLGASVGVTIAWGWLLAETNQRLKATLPFFIRQRRNWQAGAQAGTQSVELTVDHRYRDGHTESGRTIQYFGKLPVDVERFNEWATAVLGSGTMPAETLAQAAWVGLKKGKLFSRTEYEPLLAHLVAGGTVVNLPGKGHVLTIGGRRALRQHLKPRPPIPLGGVRDS